MPETIQATDQQWDAMAAYTFCFANLTPALLNNTAFLQSYQQIGNFIANPAMVGKSNNTAASNADTERTAFKQITSTQLLNLLKRNSGGLTNAELAEKTGAAPIAIRNMLRSKAVAPLVQLTDGKWTAVGATGVSSIETGRKTANPPGENITNQGEEALATGTNG